MIEFNLLPDVKREYVRARRNKRVTILISALVSGALLAVLVVLFVGVQIVQKKYSGDLSKDIKSETKKLQDTPNINKVLTIQNQLNSLTALHDEKPVATRLLPFITQVTPAKVGIAALELDFETNTIDIKGSSDAISTVNKFVDTLKFTTYKTEDNKEGKAFSGVVLTSFGRDTKGTSYNITLKYDPIIFAASSNVTLTVPPNKITTRSETEKPDQLFQPLSNPTPDASSGTPINNNGINR